MQRKVGYISYLVIIGTLILFISSSLRHLLFKSNALDLALFDQWVYLISQNLPPISSFFGFHVVGDHAAFILYPISLLYKIHPSEYWLFLVQALGLASGCLPTYLLSLQAGLSMPYSRAISLSYLLYPALFNSNFFTDFRPESIAVPALLWAMWAAIEKCTYQLFFAIGLVLICKDSLSLTVIAFGIWLLLEHRKAYGLACILIGLSWYIFTIGYLTPFLRGGQAGGVVFYASLGSSPKEIIINIFSNPNLILGKFLSPEAFFYYFLLLVPVIIGLHWKQILFLIPALPMLLLNIISDYSSQRDLAHHYSLPIFPFVIVWLIYSIKEYQQQNKRYWLKPKILIISAIISFLALAKYDFFITRYLSNLSNISSLYNAVSLVKTKESVLTTANIAPHLAKRQTIKLLSKDRPSEKYDEIFKYILLDLINNKSEFIPDLIYQLKNSSTFKLVYETDKVFLFVRV
ncbi:MAG: DUF2079 domain-containing protein [Nostoc sp. DedVER02]|uniref:DUF2079 domain-containing protein n=1 Tax=unclassified Nostoc TaxID=2593658 RepID=UPI002AD282F6|nr:MULTISPECIES: DUF2079 domain-containing protein [unclassified Nostoc]MDZ7987456.1 DUF2079 domain-containing protein [Nostoc sp. DedVER02]MDZ8112579.1 DUF2079 domain-containing protein [Nostoc sp. DedVER01b]